MPPGKRVGACWRALFTKISIKVVGSGVVIFKKIISLEFSKLFGLWSFYESLVSVPLLIFII